MPNARKILRRIGIALGILLLLPLIADRPASVCESVDIPNTNWVVEHRVSRTCAYFYCDDFIIAVDREKKNKDIMILQFHSNNINTTVKYDKSIDGIYIDYGQTYSYIVKKTQFDGIAVKYEEINDSVYNDNKDMFDSYIALNKIETRYPPMIDGLRTFFTPNFLMKDEIAYIDKLKKISTQPFNDKHYVREDPEPPFDTNGVNTNCYHPY